MSNPAAGSAVNFALGLERLGQIGVPDGALRRYGVNLPVMAGLVGAENDSGQVNPSGYLRKGVPGQKGGTIEWRHPLTPAHFLEFLEHLFGSCVKTTLESGVYQYVFTPNWTSHINTSFWSLLSTPPIGRELGYGIKFGSLEADIGDNEAIPVVLKGTMMHGTLLGPADADPDNTGSYSKSPWIRGVVADPTAGSIYLRVQSLAPLVFKVLQSAAEPTGGEWSAAATTFTVVVGDDGYALWQIVQSSLTKLDLGIFNENKDPLQVIWPGNATTHGDLDVGDVFQFKMPGSWSDPATTELTGYTRFTSAHWLTKFKKVGDSTYLEKGVTSGKLGWAWTVKPYRGNLSRYPFDVYREPPFRPTIELDRLFVDTFFRDRMDRHGRIAVQQLFEGKQLAATGNYRETLLSEYPSMRIDERKANPTNANAIPETLTLLGETDDSGTAPNTVTVITDRNYTPSTP